MHSFNLAQQAEFDPNKHVEKILGSIGGGDYTIACWEPSQISPYHCHPHAMRTPDESAAIVPGSFVVHPPGEPHEYANGSRRTLLFRVRYGSDMIAHHLEWRGHPGWTQSAQDAEYYRRHPVRA
jgi:hypothetical protein